ncbi:uncharacterized protein FA14DRAFT_186202 [Meira miltonrushii]|uniref:Uncharacterized protein n=1 Tax=Meira miltonrushii TaxID=1280837 RepID=A0A316V564_9BASI|nr:uncharacterized protein FA14DRAFT_186202 [Meira miltonrushii]PWN31641.1 hypothetical protein FA14DRAFT_186202 [Meira miltonrushii]
MPQEEVSCDFEPPPTPINGFPDDDDPPTSLTEDEQASSERVQESLQQAICSTLRITQSGNEQTSLAHHDSSPQNLNDTTAYERAAKYWDLSKEIKVNNEALLPGKPRFQPKNSRFNWKDVRYASKECKCCESINSNRPKGKPRLPCLQYSRFERCVFCLSLNRELLDCGPRHDNRPHSHNSYPQVWSQRGYQGNDASLQTAPTYYSGSNHVASSSYDHTNRRHSQSLHDSSRNYDQGNGHKRRRSDRDERSERGSSPVRNQAEPSRIPGPSSPPLNEALTQNAAPSTSVSSINSTNQVSKDVAVDWFFSNTTANRDINGDICNQMTGSEAVKASSPKTVSVEKIESFSISATTPTVPHSDDKFLRFEELFRKLSEERKAKEELQEKSDQLQDRYNRLNKVLEKVEEEKEEWVQKSENMIRRNEELMQRDEELMRRNEELMRRNEELMRRNEELMAENTKYKDHVRDFTSAFDSHGQLKMIQPMVEEGEIP